jgi:RNA polymerase sigma-B factor
MSMGDEASQAAVAEKLARFAETRDPALRAELVAEHIGLARSLARRFANRGEPLDDLIQVASLALLKALDRFEPERGLAFSTFATPTILGELKRHFRDKGWAIRVARRVQELHLQLSREVGSMSQELGRSPTVAEIANRLAVSEDEVLEAMEAGRSYRMGSIDARAGGDRSDEGSTLAERIGTDDASLADAERRATLAPMLASLPERQRLIVYLRFWEGLTQSEIGAHLGISQMHVSRLLARSLQELREHSDASLPTLDLDVEPAQEPP